MWETPTRRAIVRYRAPDKKNRARAMSVRPPTPAGLKPKDLIGLPWRLAFALQDAGWWLRSEVVWTKTERPSRIGSGPPDQGSRDDFPAFEKPGLFLRCRCGPRAEWPANSNRVGHPDGTSQALLRTAGRSPGRHAGDHRPKMRGTETSKVGSVVLDPFAGSGTTLLAAQYLGRRWVGIELKPTYVDLIQRRLKRFDSLATQEAAG